MAGVSSGIIGGIISIFLMAFLAPFIKKTFYEWNRRKYRGYDRALNADETAWLSSNSRRLSEEKSNQRYPLWTLLLWGGFLPVITGMGICALGIYKLHGALLKPEDPSAYSWSRLEIGPSMVLAVFLGIFMSAIAIIILAQLSTTVRDYLTYHYGWGYMSPKARGEQEIREELEHQLRKEQLTSESTYDSDSFSNLIFERTSPAWKKWTSVIFIITAVFLVLDSRYSLDVYDDKIIVSPYFSLRTHTYPLTDADAISRGCTLGKSDGVEHPYLSYTLHMNDGQKVDLFSLTGRGNTPHLDTIEAIIPRLTDIKIQPTKTKSAPVVKLEATNENCISLVNQTTDTDTSKRIIALFDL